MPKVRRTEVHMYCTSVLWNTETTGYVGGRYPEKSFNFKHRAKRVENNNPENLYALDENG